MREVVLVQAVEVDRTALIIVKYVSSWADVMAIQIVVFHSGEVIGIISVKRARRKIKNTALQLNTVRWRGESSLVEDPRAPVT